MIIWLTGFPNSGKTTIGDLLAEKIFVELDLRPIRLDGDDLRLLFRNFDMSNSQSRRDLALQYVALSTYLSSQGHLVVVSVVAIFREVFELLHNQLNAKVFFLKCDGTTLKKRDTRGVFSEQAFESWLQEFEDEGPPDYVTLVNSESDPPALIANLIYNEVQEDLYQTKTTRRSPNRLALTSKALIATEKARHWEAYYGNDSENLAPSDFARFVEQKVIRKSPMRLRLLDFGCGNGRDSFYFAQTCEVVGLDSAKAAIDFCQRQTSKTEAIRSTLRFFHLGIDALPNFLSDFRPQLIYTRFVLHAMTQDEEKTFLQAISNAADKGTLLAIECRSTKDPLRAQGVKLSTEERIFGHYRRFIDCDRLLKDLQDSGWKTVDVREGHGMAIALNEDPVVIRLLATRVS